MPGNLGALALRDVLDDGGYALERAARIERPRGADPHPDYFAILAAIPRLRGQVLALAVLHILDQLLGGLAVVLMRNVQRAERLQFLAAVADHLLKRLVCCRAMMLLIKDGDADRGCFEHATPPLLTGTQRCFGIPPPNYF